MRVKPAIFARMALRAYSPPAETLSSEKTWPREHIIAELHRRGMSLRQLGFEHGYMRDTLRHALDRPYPKAERIIAAALGLSVKTIWPARYYSRRRNRQKLRRALGK